ncbi:MAG: transcription termination factor Rho [Actinomycetaceae bacterium]|nr:transcription termination factor Rho [Actinomycetaceae bacterium]
MTTHHPSQLAAMRVGELKALAQREGIKGASRMRKSELVEALGKSGDGADAAAPKQEKVPARKLDKKGSESSDSAATKAADTATSAAIIIDPKSRPSHEGKSRADERRDDAQEATASETGHHSEPVLDVKAALREDNAGHSRSHQAQTLDEIELPEGEDRPRRERKRNREDRGRGRRGRRGRDRINQVEEDANGDAPRVEQRSEDVLLPIAGVLDVESNHAFVRTSGFQASPNDVYVTLGQVRRWGMRSGDAIRGYVRPQTQQPNNRKQKYNALVRVEAINGMTIDEARERPHFKDLVPLYPNERLRLETGQRALAPRVIDLVAPIGKGQRGLIVSPPKAGKTIILQQIAQAIKANNPDVELIVVLVDERPEEVTDMERTVDGRVISSTFDRPPSEHTAVAELAIEHAKRLVELGQDVVVLLDSITRLGRAYNLAAPASGRILSGGVDASALYPPKRFFGAARNIEGGGSLTILATALVETGSKMDEVIFEEFKGTGNMELRLSRQLADKRLFPAVDMQASSTRREELLYAKEELAVVWKLRRMLGALESQQAAEFVLSKLKETPSNAAFLMMLSKMTPMRD